MGALDAEINFRDGLVPAVVADVDGPVLVLCYMDAEALARTLQTGLVHVYRRSKGRVMLKGETSGHTQRVEEVRIDCMGNSLLILVRQKGAVCHDGNETCYYRRYDAPRDALEVCARQVFEPAEVYGEPAGETGPAGTDGAPE
jgi:phosphoribosyl-AMP cyclohydrolase